MVGSRKTQIYQRAYDGVYVDEYYGVPGTYWPIGTPGLPSSNLTDALAIMYARRLNKLCLVAGDFALTENIGWLEIEGQAGGDDIVKLEIGGYSVDATVFKNLLITVLTAPVTGRFFAYDCIIYGNQNIEDCLLTRCQNQSTVGYVDMFDCVFPFSQAYDATGIAGAAYWENITGEVILVNVLAGAIIDIHGRSGFKLTIAASCTAGTVNVYGDCKVINNSGGTVVNDFTSSPKVDALTQETVGATDVNGVTWKDLLDKSTNTQLTTIHGFMVTVAGGWAGSAKVRIVDGAGIKIAPFGAELVEVTDFTSGVYYPFAFPLAVRDYKFQFRSSNAGDGAGKTLQLNNLDVSNKR